MPIPKHGRLFVFEGPDGSGKTTLSHTFAEHLRSKGTNCTHASFPGSEVGTLGKLVHELHHNSQSVGVDSVTASSLQILHLAAHVDAIESKILPALKNGQSIVLDRFWWSTWVYGMTTGVPPTLLKTIIRAERMAWGKINPTVIFLISSKSPRIDVPVPNYEQLVKEYLSLANLETHRVPIRQIKNDGSINDSITEILSYLDMTPRRSVSNGPIPRGGNDNEAKLPLNNQASVDAPFIFSRMSPAKPTIVFDTFWRFAAKRQDIFFRRLAGDPPPWTDDPVLAEYKFTNVYRASDRVSQYLIRNVIYEGNPSPEEIFFRILLFKFFNRIDTWELLKAELGTISFAEYSFERYDSILSAAMSEGKRIYSAAYIMPSGGRAFSGVSRKHQMHLRLVEQMMLDDVPARLGDAGSMGRAFEILRSYATIGDFLAYQYVTDLNYSTLTDFTEMQFVVPGPGARDGIRKCFSDLGGLNESEIIKWVAETQEIAFEDLGLDFCTLWGRALQLIDCQNLFCEVDKYARINHPGIVGITGRTRIKQRYRINRDPISVWYPPKWGLNERIASEVKYVPSF